MKKTNRSKDDEKWLKALGNHLSYLIKEKGYKSPYEFWIESAGDSISRANLDYLLKGEVDTKATTLKKIADALDIEYKELLDF